MDRLSEKRKTPRVEEKLPIKIMEGDRGIVVETKNISASGAYLITDKPMPLMSKVMVTLLIPEPEGKNNKVQCGGTVVRTTPTTLNDKTFYETAIFFDDITEKTKNMISRHVKNLIGQS
ncbi:MAG: PilZ domain-containing protein [Candidatus Omnitrophica bacterium]|nr:PilZ domain-containing protein [Candidatus Omnitrophota bacterium]